MYTQEKCVTNYNFKLISHFSKHHEKEFGIIKNMSKQSISPSLFLNITKIYK